MKCSLEEEINLAKDIAYLDPDDRPELLKWILTGCYNAYSFIFRVSNERINSKAYIDTIKDKKKILSVIASGDQILNSILFGSTIIDGFDISIFPKYYLKLKMAAVLSLDLKDYKEFFYGKRALNKGMYNTFSDKLDSDSKQFWDALINHKYNNRLVTSDLFCIDSSSINVTVNNNPYLEESNYKELKSKIKNINLRILNGDIHELRDEIKDSYDLVNLSSILVSGSPIPPTFKEHKEFFKGFNLNKNGEVLSYIFDVDYDNYEGWGNPPRSKDYKMKIIYDEHGHKEDALLVYKKLK